jgi:hypothetical protein
VKGFGCRPGMSRRPGVKRPASETLHDSGHSAEADRIGQTDPKQKFDLTPLDARTDRLPPLHSITSSARASSDCGTVRPSALAVLRLMTSSNFVGCSIGKSAGLAPLSILSTKTAARRDLLHSSSGRQPPHARGRYRSPATYCLPRNLRSDSPQEGRGDRPRRRTHRRARSSQRRRRPRSRPDLGPLRKRVPCAAPGQLPVRLAIRGGATGCRG